LLITNASTDPRFTDHPAWRLYGIESYIAVPFSRRDGRPFGVLCALDSLPSQLTEDVFSLFTLLADLIAFELEADEQQQAQAQEVERARQLATARDQFLSTVAHDLKNPLTVIRGQAGLIRRQIDRGMVRPERLQSIATGIERSTSRMDAAINELVDLTRMQFDQQLDLNRVPIDLGELVRDIANDQQQMTDRHRIHVDGPVALIGAWDQERLTRVMQNLIGNAIRYSPDGGTVTITVEQRANHAGAWAVVQVTDQGIGIPPEDLALIFEQFHRGSNVVGRVDGNGLGLYSVQQIVEQHGGTVTVKSTVGEGTTFTVALPL
jgi:signal transduction histidine kinase